MACPIAFREIDGTVVRLNAVFVALLIIAYLWSANVLFLLVLSGDFAVRLYGNKAYSPLQRLSLLLQRALSLGKKMTDAGAKRLAAHFGLLFALLLVATHYLEWSVVQYGVASLFLSCVFLEVLFNYCVGCKIYYIVKKIYPEVRL